jgi:hypothetical protein
MDGNKVRFEYNSLAVSLIQGGSYLQAVQVLKTALLTLKEPAEMLSCLPSEARPNRMNATTVGQSEAPCVHPRTIPGSLRHGIQRVRLLSRENSLALSPSNLFPLYASAFTLDSDVALRFSEAGWMAILLFNLGVTCHLQALIHHPGDDRAMKQVMDTYRKVMKVVYYMWDADERAWLIMALTCNMGHVHSHRMDFSATRHCLSLLLRLTTQPYAKKLLPPEDYKVFFDTVCLLLEGMDLTNAPAA